MSGREDRFNAPRFPAKRRGLKAWAVIAGAWILGIAVLAGFVLSLVYLPWWVWVFILGGAL